MCPVGRHMPKHTQSHAKIAGRSGRLNPQSSWFSFSVPVWLNRAAVDLFRGRQSVRQDTQTPTQHYHWDKGSQIKGAFTPQWRNTVADVLCQRVCMCVGVNVQSPVWLCARTDPVKRIGHTYSFKGFSLFFTIFYIVE